MMSYQGTKGELRASVASKVTDAAVAMSVADEIKDVGEKATAVTRAGRAEQSAQLAEHVAGIVLADLPDGAKVNIQVTWDQNGFHLSIHPSF